MTQSECRLHKPNSQSEAGKFSEITLICWNLAEPKEVIK